MSKGMKIWKVAFNNVMKNKRRSTLNMLTVGLNVFILLYGLGLVKGQFNNMFETVINMSSGHLRIYNSQYLEDKQNLPLDLNIEGPDMVLEAIKGTPHMVAATKRITRMGFISNSYKKTPVIMSGIDMEKERSMFSIYRKVDGELLTGGTQVLIGKKLASILEVGKGDSLLLFSQTVGNANNLTDIPVAGVFDAGFDMAERMNVYVPYAFAEEFLDMKDRATEIIIRLDNTENVAAAKEYVRKAIAGFPGLTVIDWKQENPGLVETAKAKITSFSTMIGILLFLAFFIIMNTLTMTVFERIPEIGTLRAIGFQKSDITRMFMAEGFFLSVFGVALGCILAAPLVYYMNFHGIVLDAETAKLYTSSFPMGNALKALNTPSDWLIACLCCLAAGLLGAWFPASRAAGTNIVAALKKGVR